ncbi:GumC family protein, partial [Lichenihabitans sp. Uapishka_5]|uniref:GumC family protein n=1 Tax=Lichenihabitans sp. Uapishka_5 TaxID=3037302 RepID=UPI0029E7CC7E
MFSAAVARRGTHHRMRTATGQSSAAFDRFGVERRRAAPSRRQGDLADILAILQAGWRTVALIWVGVVALAVAYLAVAPRSYTGSASLLIDARNRGPVGDSAVATLNSSPDAILVESQVRLIASEPVLRRVVETEHLDQDPEFAPVAPGLKARLLGLVGLGRAKSTEPDDPVRRATGALATHVAVKRSERTYIADIDVTSRDPATAARLADAVADAYIADQQAARVDAATRDSDWVLSQVTEMQAALQGAETRAEAYRRDHGIIDVNGKMLNEQNLSEAATALVQARAKVAEARARYDQVERVIASGRGADTLPDALKSPAIDKLKSQYADISRQQSTLRQTLGSRHPALLESDQQLRDIRRLLKEELARVEAGLANEYQTAQAGVVALEGEVQSLKSTTVSSNGDRVKLDELQRDVDARRAVYDRFLRARDTVKEQTSDAPIGRLVAPAGVPIAPSSPKTVAVLALATIAGLLLGAGTALLRHTLRAGR